MNIYIIGNTGSGKSTWAKMISESYGYPIIEASQELRKNNPPLTGETPVEHSKRLTEISKDILKRDINHFSDSILRKFNTYSNHIVVGIRNPFDFCKLVDPNQDLVIFLDRNKPGISTFEEIGLISIYSATRFHEEVTGNKILIKLEICDSIGASDAMENYNLITRINEHQHTIRNRMRSHI